MRLDEEIDASNADTVRWNPEHNILGHCNNLHVPILTCNASASLPVPQYQHNGFSKDVDRVIAVFGVAEQSWHFC